MKDNNTGFNMVIRVIHNQVQALFSATVHSHNDDDHDDDDDAAKDSAKDKARHEALRVKQDQQQQEEFSFLQEYLKGLARLEFYLQ